MKIVYIININFKFYIKNWIKVVLFFLQKMLYQLSFKPKEN